MKKTSLLLMLALFFQVAQFHIFADNNKNKKPVTQLKREYITPKQIVWMSDKSGTFIQNSEALLVPGNGQADLVGESIVTLKGNKKNPPAILLDFGKELHGGLRIITGMFEGNLPIKIRVTFGESVGEALSLVDSSTATNDHAMRDFEIEVPWLGSIEVGNSGFQFAKIQLVDTNRTLKLKEISAISIMRDIPYLGSFKCNDERLNEIWETGAYTVHLNMQDFLWDGIKRDRLVWVGDMHPEVMTILSVFGANEVVPKSLDLIQHITPLPEWMNGISSYSMWWLIIQYEWYMYTGDVSYLSKHKDYIFSLLNLLETKIGKTGSEQLDGGRFLDWPTSPNTEAIHAGLQSLMVISFEKGVEIAKIFKEPILEQKYQNNINLLKKHIPSPNGNKAAAALMALSGLSNPKIANKNELAVNGDQGISTFYGYYVLKARALAGDYKGAMDVIRNYWGGMLDLGATTFWEDFDLKWIENAGRIDEITPAGKVDVHAAYGGYCYVGYRHSLCHGWASGPTSWLSENVLGIKILEPGCKKVQIIPHLGDLKWVEGSYPTPYGVIKVKHTLDKDGKVVSEIDVPKEIEVVTK